MKKLQILFIGNSHTYLHYMPRMLAGLVLASERGIEPEFDQSVGQGISLAQHWQNDQTREKMRRRKWDFIVLQDRSGGPLEAPPSFQRHARLLAAEINRLNSRPIYFLTWANRNRPQNQPVLNDAYRAMAAEGNCLLAPVGPAWTRACEKWPNLVLHHRDGRHANPAGAYLTACVFYSTLFQTDAIGLPANFFIKGKLRPNQEERQARQLQQAAWDAVRQEISVIDLHSADAPLAGADTTSAGNSIHH
jgi:hypothetical protein